MTDTEIHHLLGPTCRRRRCRCGRAWATPRKSSRHRGAGSTPIVRALSAPAGRRPSHPARATALRPRSGSSARSRGTGARRLQRHRHRAIAEQASVDKVLIHRYFGGLPELLAPGESGRFCDASRTCWSRPVVLLSLPTASATRASSSTSSTRPRLAGYGGRAGRRGQRANERPRSYEAEREHGRGGSTRAGWPKWTVAAVGRQARTPPLVAVVQHLPRGAGEIRVLGGVDLRSDEGWDELNARFGNLARAPFRRSVRLRANVKSRTCSSHIRQLIRSTPWSCPEALSGEVARAAPPGPTPTSSNYSSKSAGAVH